MGGLPDVVGPDSNNYQPSQVPVRARPAIGFRIANPPVGDPGAIVPYAERKPFFGGMPAVVAPPPAQQPSGATVTLADVLNPAGKTFGDPAIKGFGWPFHNPFAGPAGPNISPQATMSAPLATTAPFGPGMPAVVGGNTVAPPVTGGGLPPVVGPPGGIEYLGPSSMLKDPTQPWTHGRAGRQGPPSGTFTEATAPDLRGMARQTFSALPKAPPKFHSGAEDDLTGKAVNTDAAATAQPRQAPPAISLNQLRALTALLPRQPTPTEFGQRDILSQITAQRQAMIDAAGNDPVKLAQAYAVGKSALERLVTPGSVYSALGIGGGGMVDPATIDR